MKKNNSLKDEIKNELTGLVLIAVSLFMTFCFWQGDVQKNVSAIGAIGGFVFRTMTSLIGNGKIILAAMVFIGGVSKIWLKVKWNRFALFSWVALFLSSVTILHMTLPAGEQTIAAGWEGLGGGVTGAALISVIETLFGETGAYIVLAALTGVSLVGIFQKPFSHLIGEACIWLAAVFAKTRTELAEFIFVKVEDTGNKDRSGEKKEQRVQDKEFGNTPFIFDHTESGTADITQENSAISPALVKTPLKLVKGEKTAEKAGDRPAERTASKKINEMLTDRAERTVQGDYILPPFELLQLPTKVKSQRLNKDITDNVHILEETLDNFGVKAKVTQVSRGPSITRYEIQPPPGVKVSRIVSLADDIALSLAAPQVRIEAPIPGKAAVGIEVPNEETAVVMLREVLETNLFQKSESKLTIALGKDIAGNPIIADLGKMPHLLIAGATGSGKSVCLNAIIASILFKATPDEVKLLMIDPKVVELSNFNGIPHLISPVVTDAKKAATILRWAVHEMENRYELFAGLGVKDIYRYNQVKKSEDPIGDYPLLPYVLILIDELADLMMVAPADVEDAICRLAQMARAAGIHLVVATQRPSVDVITGIIKANIPSRIAFAVSSQTDSRTILDMSGAERLLGRGDMLFYPTGMAKPLRVQGAYVSDQEMENLVAYLQAQKQPHYITPWQPVDDSAQEETEEDELLPHAARLFIESGQASISLLQRRFRIGYTRAARIIDQMEQKGIIGGYEGSKPRAIRITWEEYERMFGN